MTRVRFSPEARRDLDEIWFYIAHDSLINADRFIDRLVNRCVETLSTAPKAGRLREEFGTGVRGFPIERYIVFYRYQNGTIDILRAVHAARDLRAVFGLDQ